MQHNTRTALSNINQFEVDVLNTSVKFVEWNKHYKAEVMDFHIYPQN